MNIIHTLVEGLSITDEEKKNFEIYQYGIKILFELFINMLCSIALAIILGKMREVIFFFAVFIPLRMLSGGPHFKKYVICLATSIGTLFFLIYLSELVILSKQAMILGFFLGALGIVKCSPLDARGHLSSKEKHSLNVLIRKYLSVLSILLILLLLLHFNTFAQLLILVIDMMGMILFIGYIREGY